MAYLNKDRLGVPRRLILVATVLVGLCLGVGVAWANMSNFYLVNSFLTPATAASNYVYHNYQANEMNPQSSSMPTGIYFLTQGGIKTGTVNGIGRITVIVTPTYFTNGFCWNRSSVYSYYVLNCADSWG